MTEAPAPAPYVTNVIRESHNRGKAVIDRLTALQDAHRLAIHMIEEDECFVEFNPQAWKYFQRLSGGKLSQSLREGKNRYLTSLSLLPSHDSAAGMCPYNVTPGSLNNYGYLFDLSQVKPNAAKVIRVHNESLCSQNGGYTDSLSKLLGFLHSPFKPLNEFYNRFKRSVPEWDAEVIKAMGSQDGCAHAELQLDTLGKEYRGENLKRYINEEGIVGFNEVVAAVNTSHITGIVIPSFRCSQLRYTEKIHSRKYYDAKVKLQAALVGLNHLDEKIQLPVLIYHVDQPNQGKMGFVGKTERELKITALTALKEIAEENETLGFSRADTIIAAVRDRFGIDATYDHYATLDNMESWMGQAVAQLAALTPSPASSPPPRQTSPASASR